MDFSKAFDKVPHGGMVWKFVDDTKIDGIVGSEEGYLGMQRLRGDLLEVYKIMRGIDRVDSWQLFPLVNVLGSIQVDKSLALDQVYPRMLWEVREEITRPLAEIFVSSTAMDEVPEDGRVANVVSLFKKGCKEKRGTAD
eukprot:g24843.t1